MVRSYRHSSKLPLPLRAVWNECQRQRPVISRLSARSRLVISSPGWKDQWWMFMPGR